MNFIPGVGSFFARPGEKRTYKAAQRNLLRLLDGTFLSNYNVNYYPDHTQVIQRAAFEKHCQFRNKFAMSDDQLRHLEVMYQNYLRRLRILEEKAAVYGINTQPEVHIEIEDIRVKLVQLEQDIEKMKDILSKAGGLLHGSEIKRRTEFRLFGISLWSIYEYEDRREYRVLGIPIGISLLGSSAFKFTTAGIISASIVGVTIIGAFAYANRGWINGSNQADITSTQPTLVVAEPTRTSVAGIATNPTSTPALDATLPIGPSVVGMTTTPTSTSSPTTAPSPLGGTCFVDLFADTPSERVVLLEIGETEHDVPIAQSSAPGATALDVILTERGLPIGAVRFALNMNARITNVDRVVTADCTETRSYRNVSRPNAQATLQDSEFLELIFGDKRYFVSLNYRVIKVRLLAKAE